MTSIFIHKISLLITRPIRFGIYVHACHADVDKFLPVGVFDKGS
ncbi:hypothetical protein HanXRQr2_Chr02g0078971 [Helianthus annuus]|uniref:Uncharacterized protein n=1 Tax=Helianthus annuus TaxID=4232 RepID=A0A9K3P0J9_HELAN|nr:hypothetical protein HanXRQr2_Chr02g0078971 [Helianthus annuus]KAJ0952817.1 hypothetical protein HanPSC8_Chr02g0076701 [Helianthus annuus]